MTQPMITAQLHDGPLNGTKVEVESLQGRPPLTIDLPSADGSDACRYCLDGLVHSGGSAAYTFLYRV